MYAREKCPKLSHASLAPSNKIKRGKKYGNIGSNLRKSE